ncbi:hypothetical protein BDC45DRAFT_531255 [Circinella umbellata]|nr:hypothetical protein BDC45DRAFT_531255 [Circinella umbellata]
MGSLLKTLSFVQIRGYWTVITITLFPPRNGKGHLACGCTSQIVIRSTDNAPGMVYIKCYWRHEGHHPNSIGNLQSAPASREIKDLIQEIVEKGLTWKNVKNMIRLNKDRLLLVLRAIALYRTMTIVHQKIHPLPRRACFFFAFMPLAINALSMEELFVLTRPIILLLMEHEGHINTNNYVEAWHRALKKAYLGKLKR